MEMIGLGKSDGRLFFTASWATGSLRREGLGFTLSNTCRALSDRRWIPRGYIYLGLKALDLRFSERTEENNNSIGIQWHSPDIRNSV